MLGALLVLTLRRLARRPASAGPLPDIEWYRPMQRLLKTDDFDYLRRCGCLPEKRIRRLRSDRRRIFRQYFRSLIQDYRRLELAIQTLLLESAQDRPELAAALFRQKVAFYRGAIAVEFGLALHAIGLDSAPRLDLLGSFENLLGQFRQLAPAYELT